MMSLGSFGSIICKVGDGLSEGVATELKPK